MNPRPQRGSAQKWVLELPTGVEPEAVADIPGLHFDGALAAGSIDAVAAGAVRLGLPPPEPPALQLRDVPEQLRPYQREGVHLLYSILRRAGGALLADDMGLGKTVQAITVARQFDGRRFVVCPGSVRETWRDDLTKWGETDVAILGPPSKKAYRTEWDKAPTARWVVTSYDLADKAFDLAFQRAMPTVAIVDEAHMVKGRKNSRSNALRTVFTMVRYKMLLTGTPIWDRPRDFYQLLAIIVGRAFGSGFEFDSAYCEGKLDEHNAFDNTGVSRPEELRLRLGYYMVRREKREVLNELPSLSRQVMWVDGNAKATTAYQRSLLGMSHDGVQSALEATLLGKMDTAFELAAQLRKFVLFTWKREHARQMAEKLCTEWGTPCVHIDGSIDMLERQARIKLAVAKGWGVVATMDSVGTGVDALKHVSSTAIMHALDYVPKKMAQVEARLHRLGQTENVHIIYLAMRDSVDERVVKTVVEKMDAARSVLGGEDQQGLKEVLDVGVPKDDENAALRALYEALEDA